MKAFFASLKIKFAPELVWLAEHAILSMIFVAMVAVCALVAVSVL